MFRASCYALKQIETFKSNDVLHLTLPAKIPEDEEFQKWLTVRHILP